MFRKDAPLVLTLCSADGVAWVVVLGSEVPLRQGKKCCFKNKKATPERRTDVVSFPGNGDGEMFLCPPNVTTSAEPEEKAPQKVA